MKSIDCIVNGKLDISIQLYVQSEALIILEICEN